MPRGQRGRMVCSIEGCSAFVDYGGLCHKHAERKRRTGDPLGSSRRDALSRFMVKVARPHGPEGCWLWTAGIMGHGYGSFFADGQMRPAHRWLYQQTFGPIPDGMELDHLCRNRTCVNPSHLEPVTHLVNVRRGEAGLAGRTKTHCKNGHPFDEINTYVMASGHRVCRPCRNEATKRWQARRRQAS